jgi:hypothetical protein
MKLIKELCRPLLSGAACIILILICRHLLQMFLEMHYPCNPITIDNPAGCYSGYNIITEGLIALTVIVSAIILVIRISEYVCTLNR